ncbi:MAG: gamma carbonic anhydrase family protein [Candidatus Omnitrophica bacterium]|nr:gamma carbonic anhydrase family protein [Candidatus Omnitrophota bacterium]
MIEPFQGKIPRMDPTAWVHPKALVIGRVTLGPRVSVWPGVVLRGDILPIEVGEESNLQDLTIAHTSGGAAPVVIGKRVTVGHRVILHGVKVGDDALIGMGSILLDGSEVGEGAILAAGALLAEGAKVPPGQLAVGIPARVIRPVKEEERRRIREGAKIYLELMEKYRER